MRKKYFIIVINLIGFLGFGQDLLDIVVPSPQAFEVTKYGAIPANEFSGKVSPSIPLHTYKSGKLELPILLTYSGNAVKVEQKPTWTGIGWLLNAGGVITRVVNDLPDETVQPRNFYSYDEFQGLFNNYIMYSNTNPPYIIEQGERIDESFILNNLISPVTNHIDSEADIFNFSFSSFSGTFFLKEVTNGVFEAKLLKHDVDLKIEILGNFSEFSNYEIKITTPDGISYYFGGDTLLYPGGTEYSNTIATEESQIVDRTTGIPNYGKQSKTAFYLTKIENKIGDVIYLEYYTNPIQETFLATNIKISYPYMSYPAGSCASESNLDTSDMYIKNITYNSKFLKRIWSNQNTNTITFNSFEIENKLPRGLVFGIKYRVLSDINFGTGRVDFDYIPNKNTLSSPLENREKFFLQKVIFKNQANTEQSEEYSLEYNDPLSLPKNCNSKSQDYLGLFNGKNNATLLPRDYADFTQYYMDLSQISLSRGIPSFNNSNLGDRSHDFTFASKGMLTKITYPTKGYTVFEYEPVTRDKKYLYAIKSLTIYNDNGLPNIIRNPIIKLTDFVGIGSSAPLPDGSPDPNDVPSYFDQQAEVTLNVNTYNHHPFNLKDYIYIKLINIDTGNETIKKCFFPEIQPDAPTQFSCTFTLHLEENGRFTVSMGIGRMPGDVPYTSNNLPPNSAFTATASIKYIYGEDLNYINGPGVRVKRIKDFDHTNTSTPTNIRRFYYTSVQKALQNESTENNTKIVFHPLFVNFEGHTRYSTNNQIESNSGMEMCNILNACLNTNSLTLNLPSSDTFAVFPIVTISLGGDNFEKGAIEKRFLLNYNSYAENVWTPKNQTELPLIEKVFYSFNDSFVSNHDSFNGFLINEQYWTKRGNTVYKIKEIKNTPILSIFSSNNNVRMAYMDYHVGWHSNRSFYIGCYSSNSYKLLETTSVTKDFLAGVPLNIYTTPPVVDMSFGWQNRDDDNDGITNDNDDDFITPTEFAEMSDEEKERDYSKIVQTTTHIYNENEALIKESTTLNSASEEVKTKYFYPVSDDISYISSSLTNYEISGYNSLKNENRIEQPIYSENFINGSKISSTKHIYRQFFSDKPFQLNKIQSSKAENELEDNLIFCEYDAKGNPTKVQKANGTITAYVWGTNRKLLYKIVNFGIEDLLPSLSNLGINPMYGGTIQQNQNLINFYTNSQVTCYNYDTNDLLYKITQSNGDYITYHYDEFNRLQFVKDKDGNILTENELHYITD